MYDNYILTNRNEATALRFLQYIGGCGLPAPQMAGWPDGLLKALIYKHRLEVRASFVFQTDSSVISKALSSWIKKAAGKTITNSLRQLEIIRELYECSPSLPPSILIKGNQPFIQTGELSDICRTEDIDLIFRDPSTAKSVLENDGHDIVPFSLKPAHEFVNFRFRDAYFDCHEYVPTLFPPLPVIDYSVGEIVFTHCPSGSINFSDIIIDAQSPAMFAGAIRAPSPSMNAIISIVTMYRDYLCSHSPYRRRGDPPIRFNDLLRIQTFLRSSLFDARYFKQYLDGATLQYPAIWVAKLLLKYLSDRTLIDILGLSAEKRGPFQMSKCYPQIMLWCMWHGFKSSAASYILRHPSVEETIDGTSGRISNVKCNLKESCISGVKLPERAEKALEVAPGIDVVAAKVEKEISILIRTHAERADTFRLLIEGPGYSVQIGVETNGSCRILNQSSDNDHIIPWVDEEGIHIRCNVPSWTSCKLLFAMVSYKFDVMASNYAWIWTVDLQSL